MEAMQRKNYFWIAESTLFYIEMLPLKFHGDLSTCFGTFDSFKYSLQNLKIGQNQNFKSRKSDRKTIFMLILLYTFQGIDPVVLI